MPIFSPSGSQRLASIRVIRGQGQRVLSTGSWTGPWTSHLQQILNDPNPVDPETQPLEFCLDCWGESKHLGDLKMMSELLGAP